MMNGQQRDILTKKLVALLGFEDGADDVLSHLLTIEAQSVSSLLQVASSDCFGLLRVLRTP